MSPIKMYKEWKLKKEWEEIFAEERRVIEFDAICKKNMRDRLIKEAKAAQTDNLGSLDQHVFQVILPLKVTVDENNKIHMTLQLTQLMGYDFTAENQAQVQKDLALEYIKSELVSSLRVRVYEQNRKKAA